VLAGLLLSLLEVRLRDLREVLMNRVLIVVVLVKSSGARFEDDYSMYFQSIALQATVVAKSVPAPFTSCHPPALGRVHGLKHTLRCIFPAPPFWP